MVPSPEQFRRNVTLPYGLRSPDKACKVEPTWRLENYCTAIDKKLADRLFHDAHAFAVAASESLGVTAETLTLLGQTSWELRQTTVAMSYLESAAAEGAADERFHLVYSKVLRGIGRFYDAVRHAEHAATLNPDDEDVICSLAIAKCLAGDQAGALETLAAPAASLAGKKIKQCHALIQTFQTPDKLDASLFSPYPEAPLGFETRPIEVDYPFVLQDIELTNHCPMKCVMCPRTHSMTRELGHMSFATFKNLIDQWHALDPTYGNSRVVWLHHYGESLVHPQFDKFIKYGRTLGVPVGLSINPLILTPPIAKRLIESEPHTLWIALDGHDNESFENVRGVPRAYEKSKLNALRFAEMKAASECSTNVELIMINFPQNGPSIDQVTEFWSKIAGIDKFQAKPFTTWDGSVEIINALNPDPDKMKARQLCNFPWAKLSVLYTGDIVACCYDYDGKYVLGNVNRETLSEIWNGPRIKHLRSSLNSGLVLNRMCQNCENLCSA